MKIAVITHQEHFKSGGIEKAINKLYNKYSHIHEFTEFPCLFHPKSEKIVRKPNPRVKIDKRLYGWKPSNIIWAGSYTKKHYNYIYNNFDMVIIRSMNPPRTWLRNPKTVFAQCMDTNYFGFGHKPWQWQLGFIFSSIFFNNGGFKNVLAKASNVVFYSKETEISIKGNVFYAPNTSISKKNMIYKDVDREGFVWVGRLENIQKNVKAAVKIANLKNNFVIYGNGNKRFIKKLKNQKQYQGSLNHDDVLEVIRNAKALIVTSNYEGFTNTIPEALSVGTPVITFNTFKAVELFAKSGGVFKIENKDINSVIKCMHHIESLPKAEFKKMSRQCYEFAYKYLTEENYYAGWDNVFKSFMAKQKGTM